MTNKFETGAGDPGDRAGEGVICEEQTILQDDIAGEGGVVDAGRDLNADLAAGVGKELAAVDADVVEVEEGCGGCICRCAEGAEGSTGIDHGAIGEVEEEAAFKGEIRAGEGGEGTGIGGECGDLADVEEEVSSGVDGAGVVDWGEEGNRRR